MSEPAAKGRGWLFWALVLGGGSCAACSCLTLGLMGLGALSSDESKGATGSASASRGALPTGETPNLYPGSPGWLPSGRGVPIPEARVVDGRPEGLWWRFQALSDGNTMGAGVTLFLADGTCATNPRPGGGRLFDLAGQRAQRGNTGVGTCEVSGGRLTQRIDGYATTEPFSSGEDGDGPWFLAGPARSTALRAPRAEELVGAWKGPSSRYTFRSDGTFEMGTVQYGGGYVVAAGGQGTWQVDGYLLQFRAQPGPMWISVAGVSGSRFLVVGTGVFTRQ